MTKLLCEDCEKVFSCKGWAHYCPRCRKRRISETAKRRNLNKLGNDAYSAQQKRRKEENGQS